MRKFIFLFFSHPSIPILLILSYLLPRGETNPSNPAKEFEDALLASSSGERTIFAAIRHVLYALNT